MTAAERRHLDRVAALGCCICGRPAAIHAGRVGWANRHGTEAEWLDWVEDRVGVLA